MHTHAYTSELQMLEVSIRTVLRKGGSFTKTKMCHVSAPIISLEKIYITRITLTVGMTEILKTLVTKTTYWALLEEDLRQESCELEILKSLLGLSSINSSAELLLSQLYILLKSITAKLNNSHVKHLQCISLLSLWSCGILLSTRCHNSMLQSLTL